MYRRLRPFFIIYIILFGFILNAFSDDKSNIKIKSSIDKAEITIGDRINYSLSFTYPKNLKLEPPQNPKNFGLWEIKDIQTQTREENQAENETTIKYLLTTFSTGQITIPEITFKFSDENQNQSEVKTNPLNINVISLFAKFGDLGDIKDIKPPLSLAPSILYYLKWILIILVIFAGYIFIRNKFLKTKEQEMAIPKEPARPPHLVALEELEKLKNSDLLKEGRIKEFYIALSDIIRNYFSSIYSIDALDKTTYEIFQELRQIEQDKKTLGIIRDFLDECDLVKFAKYKPLEYDILTDWETAKKIVETKA